MVTFRSKMTELKTLEWVTNEMEGYDATATALVVRVYKKGLFTDDDEKKIVVALNKLGYIVAVEGVLMRYCKK